MSDQPQPEQVENSKPKGGAMRILLIVLGVLLLGIVMCGLATGGLTYTIIRATQPAADASRAFLEALADENYDSAFSMMSSGLQSEFGNASGLEERFIGRQIVRDEIGAFLNRSITNDEATMSAFVTFENGASQQIALNLRYDNSREAWLVTGFRFD